MDSIVPENPAASAPELATRPQPRVWKFWGTLLWGLLVTAAMFAAQIAVVIAFAMLRQGRLDFAAMVQAASGSLTISLSVIMGLPAVLLTLWIAIRRCGTPYTEYLALRRTSLRDILIGVGGMLVVVLGWTLLSRITGREASSDVMGEVLQSARSSGALWLMSLAFCVAAPATEELLVRGFLYRGWSETRLGPWGAITLSSLLWTGLHLQYGWFLLGEVFCIGLWLGYMRYRSASIWLTILLHGLNNSAAMVATIWLGQG